MVQTSLDSLRRHMPSMLLESSVILCQHVPILSYLSSGHQVKSAMHSACSNDMNERQELAVQRGLQRAFSMVQGPPGTGKTSFLVQCVAALVSASRQRKRGRLG